MKITAILNTDEIKQALANYVADETGGRVSASSISLTFEKGSPVEPGSRDQFRAEIDVEMEGV